jgi:hypothetical protein
MKVAGQSTQRRYESAQCTYTSPLWHFVDTFTISSMMRGKDGVLVLGIHLMLLGQGKSIGLYDTRLRLQDVTYRTGHTSAPH